MHFSALVFVVLPLGNIMLPLIFWLIRKNDILHISYFAKNLLNFQLTWTILVCFPFVWKLLCHVFNIEFSVIPYILSPWTFIIFHFFFLYLLNATYLIIVGSIVSKKPKNYFPISIRFIKQKVHQLRSGQVVGFEFLRSDKLVLRSSLRVRNYKSLLITNYQDLIIQSKLSSNQ